MTKTDIKVKTKNFSTLKTEITKIKNSLVKVLT